MAAYLIADIEITDPQAYEGYRKDVAATIEAYGGRYLTRGAAVDVLEGDWSPKRLVILEFPTMAKLEAWYDCPEYQPLRELRKRASVSKLIVQQGL